MVTALFHKNNVALIGRPISTFEEVPKRTEAPRAWSTAGRKDQRIGGWVRGAAGDNGDGQPDGPRGVTALVSALRNRQHSARDPINMWWWHIDRTIGGFETGSRVRVGTRCEKRTRNERQEQNYG